MYHRVTHKLKIFVMENTANFIRKQISDTYSKQRANSASITTRFFEYLPSL